MNKENSNENLGCLATPLGCLSAYIFVALISWAINNNNDMVACIVYLSHNYPAFFMFVISLIIFPTAIYVGFSMKFTDDVNSIKKTFQEKKQEVEQDYKEKSNILEKEHNTKLSKIERREIIIKNIINTESPFKYSATLIADIKSALYADAESRLRYKSHPAVKAADEVKKIKESFKQEESKYKELLYKYELLFEIFPELEDYVESDKDLLDMGETKSFEGLIDERKDYDRVRDWIDGDEYKKLSVTQRNQLALDRYKNRKKSNRTIGLEYELYIGYLLRSRKLYVTQFGIDRGLNDLGRDIIAEEININGSRTIYVIQCKRWAKDKVIHENVICQLFGTTLEYKYTHKSYNIANFIPVLVTTVQLSETAKEFAKHLEVEVRIIPMGDYPMIKCNIDTMIYHLPFDQQYYTTQIKESKGEFYAWTVEEAEKKGYRRACKHFINK